MSKQIQTADWWRAVLGEYPTGVTLITSATAEGTPVGMVVGTFTAVSQDPPLIGFFPDATSTTFPIVAANGRFSASVLGTVHEQLCRDFVRKAPDRFDSGTFVYSESGIPRLADAVAWFEATIIATPTHGDHTFVVASVDDFGVGDADAGLPMLFRRGGYGSFAAPQDEFESGVLARRIRFADAANSVVADLADELGEEILVSTVVGDSVIVLSATRPSGRAGVASRSRLGVALPFAAPLAPAFVAWASADRQSTWIESSRHLVGAVDRQGLAALLASVRRRGYGVSADQALAGRMEELMNSDGPRRESFARLWSDVSTRNTAMLDDAALSPATVNTIQVPVFGPDGDVELGITVNGFSKFETIAEMHAAADRVLAAGRRLTEQIGGVVPSIEVGAPA